MNQWAPEPLLENPRGEGPAAEPMRRPPEIEDPTNLWFVHPLSARLVPVLAARGVHPNAVSAAGMLCGLLAGFAYADYRDGWAALAGFALMLAWHVLDGADGQLARLTHLQSHLGKVLDGVCDYVTNIAVYVGLAWALASEYGGWVWAVAAVSGACHAVHGASYEMQREEFALWSAGKDSTALAALMGETAAAATTWPQRLADLLYRPYVRVQLAASGLDRDFHARLSAALRAATPQAAKALRQRYREAFVPALRRWTIMSANYRTLGIFLCALAGQPLVYFGFEIVVFTFIWLLLLVGQKARRRAFLRALDDVPAHAEANLAG